VRTHLETCMRLPEYDSFLGKTPGCSASDVVALVEYTIIVRACTLGRASARESILVLPTIAQARRPLLIDNPGV
jgi:hypothetical protein